MVIRVRCCLLLPCVVYGGGAPLAFILNALLGGSHVHLLTAMRARGVLSLLAVVAAAMIGEPQGLSEGNRHGRQQPPRVGARSVCAWSSVLNISCQYCPHPQAPLPLEQQQHQEKLLQRWPCQ